RPRPRIRESDPKFAPEGGIRTIFGLSGASVRSFFVSRDPTRLCPVLGNPRSARMAVGDIIAGLDLGTTKVTAIVAEQTEDGLDIIGVGSVPARGLKRGVVVNIEATVQAIKAAVE